jgi:hypothetical protein
MGPIKFKILFVLLALIKNLEPEYLSTLSISRIVQRKIVFFLNFTPVLHRLHFRKQNLYILCLVQIPFQEKSRQIRMR